MSPFDPGPLGELLTLRARPDDTAQKTACPTCHMVHAGDCLERNAEACAPRLKQTTNTEVSKLRVGDGTAI